jgi:hypothetical protein
LGGGGEGELFLRKDERKRCAKFINNFILQVLDLCGDYSLASTIDIHLHGIQKEKIFSTSCYPICKENSQNLANFKSLAITITYISTSIKSRF